MLRLSSRSFFIYVALFLILFLTTLHPLQSVVSDSHDWGSAAALEYWTSHHMMYGVDVVQNMGPLGFISSPDIYTGFLSYSKIILSILLSFTLAALALHIAGMLPKTSIRFLFLFLVWIFTEPDVEHYLLSLMIGYTLLLPGSVMLYFALIPILVILSLAKSTLLFISFLILFASALHHSLKKQYGLAILLPACYVMCFTAAWIMVGQPLTTMGAFLSSILHFSHGYNEAMSYFENPFVTCAGLASLGLAYYAISLRRCTAKHGPLNPNNLPPVLLESIILFIVWKHGFTRADGHVAKFFAFLAVIAPLLLYLPVTPPLAAEGWRNWLRPTLLTLIIAFCLTGFERTYRFRGDGEIFLSGIEWHQGMKISQLDWSKTRPFGMEFGKMNVSINFLKNMPEHLEQLDSQLADFIHDMQLPKINAQTGKQNASYFGMRPAVMLYNTFHYIPLPSTISFAAWNGWIIEKNIAFLRNETYGPPYILYQLSTMDNRLTAQDDPFSQLEMLQRYDAVLQEKGALLLKRRSGVPPFAFDVATPFSRHKTGDWVDLPATSNPLWLRIDVPHTVTERLLAAFYKPPQYMIDYTLNDGKTYTNKFIPITARLGFMASPLITTNDEFIAAHITGQNTSLHAMVKFRIYCVHEAFACPEYFKVSTNSILGLQLGRQAAGSFQD